MLSSSWAIPLSGSVNPPNCLTSSASAATASTRLRRSCSSAETASRRSRSSSSRCATYDSLPADATRFSLVRSTSICLIRSTSTAVCAARPLTCSRASRSCARRSLELRHGASSSAGSRAHGRQPVPAPGRSCRPDQPNSSCSGSTGCSCHRGTADTSRQSCPGWRRSTLPEQSRSRCALRPAPAGSAARTGRSTPAASGLCSLSRPNRGSPGRSLMTKNQPGSSSGFSPDCRPSHRPTVRSKPKK